MIIVAAQLDYEDREARDAATVRTTPVQLQTRLEEPGCQAYCFAADPAVDTRIQVYELWDDESSLAAHFKHPYYGDMKKALRPGLIGSWNQMYLSDRHEPVYTPDGSTREKFFTSPAKA